MGAKKKTRTNFLPLWHNTVVCPASFFELACCVWDSIISLERKLHIIFRNTTSTLPFCVFAYFTITKKSRPICGTDGKNDNYTAF